MKRKKNHFQPLGMQSGTIDSASPWGLSLKEKLLPQYLKEIGYKTHAIGKVMIVHHIIFNDQKLIQKSVCIIESR